LSAVLLGGERNEELEGIKAVAKVIERKVEKKRKHFLNITIQKRIEGITVCHVPPQSIGVLHEC